MEREILPDGATLKTWYDLIVNLWGRHCAACRYLGEMIQKFGQEHPVDEVSSENFSTLLVSIQITSDGYGSTRHAHEERQMPTAVGMDN